MAKQAVGRRALGKTAAVRLVMLMAVVACSSSGVDSAGSESGSGETSVSEQLRGATTSAQEPASTPVAGNDATPTSSTSIAIAPTTTTPTTQPARSIEELEEQWAATRQTLVAELQAGIEAGSYGIGDDGVLRGPGGFDVDLAQCPDDWDDMTGVSDNEIHMGHTAAFSSLAAYWVRVAGIENYFDHVNEQGGVDGRALRLVTKDDGFFGRQTVDATEELLEAEDVLWISAMGTPTALAVRGLLNEQCVPQPFVMSGHPLWSDAEHFPWSTGLELSYSTEAGIWGEWIRTNLADELPVTVGALVMDNGFGYAYEDAFREFAEQHPEAIAAFVPVRHDPAAEAIANEVAEIATADPDVFLSMTAGNPCRLALQAVADSGLGDTLDAAFTPSVCRGPNAYLIPAGDDGDGWLTVAGGIRDHTDPRWANNPYIRWMNDELATLADGWEGADRGIGFGLYGFAHVEALRVAAELPGGVSRTNLMLAIRGLRLDHPLLPTGVALELQGTDDSFAIEGSEIQIYNSERHRWESTGQIIEINGLTPPCHHPEPPADDANGFEARCEPQIGRR